MSCCRLWSARQYVGPGKSSLPIVEWQSSDYAAWQHKHFDEKFLAGHQRFWEERLAGVRYVVIPEKPEYRSKPEAFSRQARPLASSEWFRLDSAAVAALRAVAREERTTLFV
jgi:hypothetical protein